MLRVSLAIVAALAVPVQDELVLLKEGGAEYHRPACAVVRDAQGVVALTRAQAESRGLKPHDGCDPSKAVPPGARQPPPSPDPILVTVDQSKYYHRDSCRKLEGNTRKIDVEAAAKTHWPCPACKPPLRKRPAPAIPKRGPPGLAQLAPDTGSAGCP